MPQPLRNARLSRVVMTICTRHLSKVPSLHSNWHQNQFVAPPDNFQFDPEGCQERNGGERVVYESNLRGFGRVSMQVSFCRDDRIRRYIFLFWSLSKNRHVHHQSANKKFCWIGRISVHELFPGRGKSSWYTQYLRRQTERYRQELGSHYLPLCHHRRPPSLHQLLCPLRNVRVYRTLRKIWRTLKRIQFHC